MVFGYNSTGSEDDEYLDDLAFMLSDRYGNSKFDYYKEYLLRESSDNDVVESEELILSIEPQSTSSDGPMDSPWPMSCYDVHHTSQSPYSTANNPYDEKWKFQTGTMESSVVIDDGNIIYFGNMDWDFYALNPDGTLKWIYETNGLIWSTAAIDEDGTIYIGAWDDYLHAINPDGTRKWRFNAHSANIGSSPAIADDGTIYFGSMWSLGDGGKIHAVNPDGTEKWYYQTGYAISSDPAIADDGTIYIGSGDDYLYAMNPNGTLKWRYKTGDEIHGHPSIAEDGTIYIGSYDKYLYALYPNNGTLKWKINMGFQTDGNPSIASDGTIYIGGTKLKAFYPNGTLKWSYNLGTNQYISKSSPAISADGTIYIGTFRYDLDGGFFHAINPDGTQRFSKKITDYGCFSAPAIGEDETVYIGSTPRGAYGYLYAFNRGELEADADGPHYGLINIPVQFSGSAVGGYPPYGWHWDFGDTQSSDEQNPLYTYTSPGDYTVMLTVTDDSGNTSDDSTWAWIQDSNYPPNIQDIDGETDGKEGTYYPYSFTASDPEGLHVWYYIDWDDGSNTGWIGPYDSGETISRSHKWTTPGTYTIKAKAKDPYGDEGAYYDFDVTITEKSKSMSSSLLLRILNQFPLLQQFLQRFGLY
jgi:outer membrane protein assembly factor BamB